MGVEPGVPAGTVISFWRSTPPPETLPCTDVWPWPAIIAMQFER